MIDSNTLLLLHFDDSLTTDVMGSNISLLSTPIQTSDSKFGSYAIETSSNNGLNVTYNSKFDFGTGDFTIDFWWKIPSGVNPAPSGYATVLGRDIRNNMFIAIGPSTMYVWRGYVSPNDTEISWSGFPNDGLYHHYAIVRDNGVIKFFVDGNLEGQANNSVDYSMQNTDFCLFASWDGASSLSHSLNGYIDEFRISNIARWTTNFTPPTGEYGVGSAFLSGNTLYTGTSLTQLTNTWNTLTNVQKEALVQSFSSDIPTISDLASISPFRVLTDDTSPTNVRVTGQPKAQIIIPTSLINTGAVTTLQSINITNTITDAQVRFAITTDLSTYKVYDPVQGVWVTSTNIEEDGMTIAQINSLTPQILALLAVSNGIAFKQCFIGTSENASAEVSEISAVVDIDGVWTQSVHDTDYEVTYPNKTTMSVKLKTNGDYIINYPISSNS